MRNSQKGLLALLLATIIVFTAGAQNRNTNQAIKLNLALTAIERAYVDDVDSKMLVEEAIKAMVAKLDPHSAYMTAEEMTAMNEPLQGGFDGIGISFNMMNDTLFIVEVITGGPSEKVGLLPGDRIIKVDGELIAGVKMANNDVIKRLKGPKGTQVKVDVLRKNQPALLNFRIIRDKIPIYSLDASFMVDKNTGYIKLNRFGATTAEEFKEAFLSLKEKGMEDLVLDLQSNGGGFMGAAIQLADEFLSEGKLVVYTVGKNSPRMQSLAKNNGLYENGKLVVLIDEYSASASEIVAGAIQDWDRGLIIGRRSFGKGLVQQPITLTDGSTLKLTISRYFTPSGRFIQKPYEDSENYDKDLIDRYNRGEMIHADSIHFPDSLRTQTLVNKRTIYGGGGIMPDIFVPYDTTRFTPLHRVLSTSGVLNQFSLKYVDRNRKTLTDKYKNSDAFLANYTVTDAVINQLMDYAKGEKVSLTEKDLQSDKALIKKQLKAYMIRDLWKSSEYYRVMWTENESLVKALEILNNETNYKSQLERHK